MKKIYYRIFIAIFLNIWILFFVYILWRLSFIERMEHIVNDTFSYKLQYTQNRHNDDIVIIKIDDATLDSLWKSDLWMLTFDKWMYANIIEKIFTVYWGSVLGIDIVLANPSVLGKEDEQKLTDTFEKYKKNIVIATRSDYTPYPLCIYSKVQHGAIDLIKQDRIRKFRISDIPYDLSSRCPGSKIYEGNKEYISSFSREILEIYKEKISPFKKEKIEENLRVFDNKKSDTAYIDYYSNGKQNKGTFGYTSYSFIDIYNGKKQTSWGEKIDLQGKIVLIGEVGTLLHDSYLTPIEQSIQMPGVEINANIITTMKYGRDLKEVSLFLSFLLLFFLQAIIITSVLYLRTVFAWAILLITLFFLIVLWSWVFIFGYIFNIFLWILSCILSFLCTYIYKFQVTDKAKRLLKKQFSSYVSPDVVEEISKNPNSILVQGEKRNMTILFSDIVSFTSISEKRDAKLIVEILNEYFSEMTKIIYANKGTLDKYIWDAVMCFFNAPLKQENHSFFACKTALQQQKKLRELNKIWQNKWYPEIKIRIGIHSWEAVHGNIWSSDTRVNYTVIGDSVNLASRLEWICKKYGISICVSEEVYNLQKDAFHFRELDAISVKGREKAVKIYQLIAFKNVVLPKKLHEYLNRYKQGLFAYQSQDFKKAESLFSQNIWDMASNIMAERCRDIQDWKSKLKQGVFQMHTK